MPMTQHYVDNLVCKHHLISCIFFIFYFIIIAKVIKLKNIDLTDVGLSSNRSGEINNCKHRRIPPHVGRYKPEKCMQMSESGMPEPPSSISYIKPLDMEDISEKNRIFCHIVPAY